MTIDEGQFLESHINGGDVETSRKVVSVLTCVLNKLVDRNERTLATSSSEEFVSTVFHALKSPGIPVHKYLERIVRYSPCSPECYILALVYIDRIIQFNPKVLVTALNIHRFLITSVMLAAKFFDDTYYNNAYYARVGGISVSELNTLEVEFLFLIDFSLAVEPSAFERYRSELAVHINSGNCQTCVQTSVEVVGAVGKSEKVCAVVEKKKTEAQKMGYANSVIPLFDPHRNTAVHVNCA